MKNTILFTTLLVILFVLNYQIYQKENILSEGKTVLLKLAPIDPRSLMQGDYMALRYKISENLTDRNENDDGFIVIVPDSSGIYQYVQLYSGHEIINTGELLLRYRIRAHKVKLGAESFFFQEGQGKIYQNARYGELKVSEDGESVLVGLRDEKLNRIEPLTE